MNREEIIEKLKANSENIKYVKNNFGFCGRSIINELQKEREELKKILSLIK